MANSTITVFATSGLGLGATGWAKFTGAAVIGGSLNVTSVTDNGVGDYSISWTTSFDTANYAIGTGTAGSTGSADHYTSEKSGSNKTTSTCRVQSYGRANTPVDPNTVFVTAIQN